MSEGNKTKEIFISYGHDKFKELVKKINDDLNKRGYTTWIDYEPGNIEVADNYNINIQNGLDNSNKMLLFLSLHSMRQDRKNEYGYCLNEIDYAKYKQMQIVSVVLEDVAPYLPIAAIRRIDLSDIIVDNKIDDKKYDKKLEQIIDYIKINKTLLGQDESDTILSKLNPFSYEGNPQPCKDYYERKWLTDEYLNWVFKKSDSKLLCIMGSAGSGKTEFISHLCKIKSCVSAVHFCRYNTNRVNPKKIIMSLAYYLSTQIPEYRKEIEIAVDEEHKNLAASSFDYLFDLLLEGPLNKIKNPGTKIIVIDAIDEANNSVGQNELLNLLVSRMNKFPEWLRLVITSRPEKMIVSSIKDIANFKYDIIDIDKNTESNKNDIRGFITQSLFKKISTLNAAEQKSIVNLLLEKINNNFVYASYAIKECLANEGDISDIVKNLPTGIHNYYLFQLRRLFETTYLCTVCNEHVITAPKLASGQTTIFEDCAICDKKTIHKELKTNKTIYPYDSFEPVLELVASEYEPLTCIQMFNILNTDGSLQENVFKSQINQLTSLFVLKDDCLTAPHKSLLDWLVDGGLGADFKLNIENGHKRITKYLLNTDDESFRKYKILHLIDHCLKANSLDSIVDIISDINIFNNRIELLGLDTTLKKFFNQLNELFNLNKEMVQNVFNSKLFFEIFSKFRDFINQSNIYLTLQKIGFDKVAEKIDLFKSESETIDSLIMYYYQTNRIAKANELVKLYVAKHQNWEKSAELDILNKYALINLKSGEFDLAEKICLKIINCDAKIEKDNSFLLDKMLQRRGSIRLELIRKAKIKAEIHLQIINAIFNLGLVKICNLDIKNAMLLFEKSERLFKIMYSSINSYKWESHLLMDHYQNSLSLYSATIHSVEALAFAIMGEIVNAKLYFNLWNMKQNFFGENVLSNFNNIHWIAQLMLLLLEKKYEELINLYSKIVNFGFNNCEIALIEFIVSSACYLNNNIDDALKHILCSKENISNLEFFILEELIVFLEQKINLKSYIENKPKTNDYIMKLVEQFANILNNLKK